ncbi:hypothetical protein BC831DRAFT_514518 [Entophlyctis helioformis]|nr:hypothetical protein BC831DRAFT_514518 [Entophlyctis helioformis]
MAHSAADASPATPAGQPAEHTRAIIQLDLDFFYAQVELVQDPSLRSRPVGIQQKHIIVTCNYVARAQGVHKLQLLTDALQACPHLVVIDGSDTSRYRRASGQIYRLVHSLLNGDADQPAAASTHMGKQACGMQPLVPIERLGLDELFMDVTQLIADHLDSADSQPWPDGTCVFKLPGLFAVSSAHLHQSVASSSGSASGPSMTTTTTTTAVVPMSTGPALSGFTYTPSAYAATQVIGDTQTHSKRPIPPTQQRLIIASHISAQVRHWIHAVLGYTCSGGIATSKLFAKMVAGTHKPDAQTVFVASPEGMAAFGAMDVGKVPGFGYAVKRLLSFKVPALEFHGQGSTSEPGRHGTSHDGDTDSVDGEYELEEEEQQQQQQQQEGGWCDDGVDDDLLAMDHSRLFSRHSAAAPGTSDSLYNTNSPYNFTRTIAHLRSLVPRRLWTAWFGDKTGTLLWTLVQGIDDSPVRHTPNPSQISVQDTFTHCCKFADARQRLVELASLLLERAQEEETVAMPASAPSGTSDGASRHRVWRRYPSALLITLRRARSAGSSSSSSSTARYQESKTVALPVDIFDLSVRICDRASRWVDVSLMPAFKSMVGASPYPQLAPPLSLASASHSAADDGFNVTLLGLTLAEFGKPWEPPSARSIASFFKAAATDTTAKTAGTRIAATAYTDDELRGMLDESMDVAVFRELPDDVQTDVLEDCRRRHLQTASGARMQSSRAGDSRSQAKRHQQPPADQLAHQARALPTKKRKGDAADADRLINAAKPKAGGKHARVAPKGQSRIDQWMKRPQ